MIRWIVHENVPWMKIVAAQEQASRGIGAHLMVVVVGYGMVRK